MEKKTKNIVLVCLGLVLIILISLLIMFFLRSSNKNQGENITTTTTTTTTTQKTNFVLENSGVELTVENSELKNDTKLHIEKVDVKLKNVNALAVYDITLKNSDGNVIKVSDANIKIAIPYENKDNYTKFTVLYLSDTNEVLETYNANYVNDKVVFNVNHLSRYAIVVEKDEENSTTTKKTTTKKTSTTAKPTTTTKAITKKTITTAKPTTTTTTTTTKKVMNYTIKVTSIDQYSPDRQLTVYENGTKISVSEIQYNGVTLCKGNNMVVNMFELDGINKVTVVLNNGKTVTATIQ